MRFDNISGEQVDGKNDLSYCQFHLAVSSEGSSYITDVDALSAEALAVLLTISSASVAL